MEQIRKEYFICSICGKTSQNKVKVEECEKSHMFVGDGCTIEQQFDKGKAIPRALIIVFEDGTEVMYQKGYELKER